MTTAAPSRSHGHPAVAAVADRIRAAREGGAPLRLVGAGTWLDAGRPVRADADTLPLGDARGITEYVPGDLTLTALGGTSLAEIADATAAHGQRLTLDPFGDDRGSIGATVATASAGPLAGTFGTPRDIALGMTVVTGAGEVVRAGGRVVKNVAGFDLVRLNTGAWGTLGAIVEVSVRLRAKAVADETFVIAAGADADIAGVIRTVRALPFGYEAVELLDAGAARGVGLPADRGDIVLARAAGSATMVHAMRDALRSVGHVQPADPAVWPSLRGLEPPRAATFRLSSAPTGAAATWRLATELARSAGGWAHLSIGRTVARVTLPPLAAESDAAFAERISPAIARALAGFAGTCIPERLPLAMWASDRRAAARRDARIARLEQDVHEAFDPAGILNPGILGRAGGRP